MTDREQPSQRNQIASAPQRKTSSELLPSRVRQQLDEVMRTGRLSSTILMLEDNERSALEAAIERSKALVAEDGNPGAAMAPPGQQRPEPDLRRTRWALRVASCGDAACSGTSVRAGINKIHLI